MEKSLAGAGGSVKSLDLSVTLSVNPAISEA